MFRAHDIGYFFYNGGNDSADTCLKVSQLSERLGYPLVAVHVPKTVDNDLAVTDNCPGFGSVAKYVATSMREAAFDVASMAKTSTKVFVLEVMGRQRRLDHRGGRHGARTPRRRFRWCCSSRRSRSTRRSSLAAVDANVKRFGYCCVGVSEGLKNAEGKLMAEAGTKDAFGHAQLGGVGPLIAGIVRDRLAYKFHWAVADYLQRAARHIASKTDLEHSYAVGKAAVQLAIAGTQRGDAGDHSHVRHAVSLEDRGRCRSTRSPTSRRSCRATSSPPDGFGITAKARTYLAPLIRGEDFPPFKDGAAALRAAEERRRAEEARDRSSRSEAMRGRPRLGPVETGTIACFEAATRSRRPPLDSRRNMRAQPDRRAPRLTGRLTGPAPRFRHGFLPFLMG